MATKIGFSDDTAEQVLELSQRDAGILFNRDFAAGESFCREIGVFDHFTVATGIPKGSETIINRQRLLVITRLLAQMLGRDADVLQYDYTCTWTKRADLADVAPGCTVVPVVQHRQKGFCKLVVLLHVEGFAPGREIAAVDLRQPSDLWRTVLDSCKVTRRRAEFNLLEKIENLCGFLEHSVAETIRAVFLTKG